jgi:hypothetical protein
MTETAKRFKLQGFGTKGIVNDLSAGVTKSIDSVTGGIANAVLAGVNPVYGLYTVSYCSGPRSARSLYRLWRDC